MTGLAEPGRPVPAIPVVALVSSVGGLDALSRVLSSLPAAFPAAVLALQHSDPDRHSELAAILDRAGPLGVLEAHDGAALAKGSVLVAPSGYHTLVTVERTIALVRSGSRPPLRPSADLLLTSLAITCGALAVAVVLTGLGNDGAAGATIIKRFGGWLIAADHESSREYAMPEAAIDTGLVDEVLPLEQIATELVARLDVVR